MVKVADDPSFPLRSRLVHVRYHALVADPVGTIARIYDTFGLEFSRNARATMAARVAKAPKWRLRREPLPARGIRDRSGAGAGARQGLRRTLRRRDDVGWEPTRCAASTALADLQRLRRE
jgi:Sulfotransferase family